MGETAARPLILAGENAEGAKHPPWISPKKRPARKPQTEENVASPDQHYNETANNSLKYEYIFLIFICNSTNNQLLLEKKVKRTVHKTGKLI
jgi:hypothetical protein